MTKLAVRGGTPVRAQPFVRWPIYDDAERHALTRVLESGNWGGYPSPNTEAAAFAKAFADYHGASYGVCAANGTVTLLLALRSGGVSRGDEVIVPPYTFAATPAAAVYAGAVPVFADIRASDYTIDVDAVEAAITDRTKAIICVHLASSVSDLDRLTALCKQRGLILIEDCAHMHGAKWRDRGVGSWGDFGSFSCQSSKLMTAGEGGIVLTNDKAYETRLQSLVNCGRTDPPCDGIEPWIGYNFRITEFQAAVLSAQLTRLERQTARRIETMALLEKMLAEVPGVSTLEIDSRVTTRAGYQFIVRFDSAAFANKDKNTVLAALEAEGIPVDEGYAPLHLDHELLKPSNFHQWYDSGATLPDFSTADCPVSVQAYAESIWLPHQLFLGTDADVKSVAEAFAKVQRYAAEL